MRHDDGNHPGPRKSADAQRAWQHGLLVGSDNSIPEWSLNLCSSPKSQFLFWKHATKRCAVLFWLFDSFRFLKDKGILVVGDLVAFWFGWFYEKSPMCAKPIFGSLDGMATKMSVLSQWFL